MSTETARLGIKIGLDAKEVQKGMGKALRSMEGLKVGVRAVGAAFRKFGTFMGESVQLAGVQQDALNKMGAAFKTAGVTNVQAATNEFAAFAAELDSPAPRMRLGT